MAALEGQELPFGHARHAMDLVVGAYFPALQAVATLPTQAYPAGQDVHAEAPTALVVPAGHATAAERPADGHMYPAGHGVCAALPAMGTRLPTEADMQALKLVWPVMGWYVPAGQGRDAVAKGSQYAPTGQTSAAVAGVS